MLAENSAPLCNVRFRRRWRSWGLLLRQTGYVTNDQISLSPECVVWASDWSGSYKKSRHLTFNVSSAARAEPTRRSDIPRFAEVLLDVEICALRSHVCFLCADRNHISMLINAKCRATMLTVCSSTEFNGIYYRRESSLRWSSLHLIVDSAALSRQKPRGAVLSSNSAPTFD